MVKGVEERVVVRASAGQQLCVLVGVAGELGLGLTGDATDAAINHHIVARAEVVKTEPEMVTRLPSVLPLTGVMTTSQGVSA